MGYIKQEYFQSGPSTAPLVSATIEHPGTMRDSAPNQVFLVCGWENTSLFTARSEGNSIDGM